MAFYHKNYHITQDIRPKRQPDSGRGRNPYSLCHCHKKSNMLQTGKFSQTVSSTGKPQASFRYLAKGTWYVAARSWVLDAQGNKVYGSWTKIKKIKITVITPQQPKIRNITVEGNTVTITYTKCKNAIGYEILLGNKYKTSAGEKYPVNNL